MSTQPVTREIKLVAIGNSKGIRIPQDLQRKYGWNENIVLEEVESGILLRGGASRKLSLRDTYRDMAVEQEDWSDFDSTLADGLD